MKVSLKMKNRSYRYDINRSRPRHGQKYAKYTGLHLATYCVRYPHTVPFVRNEITYFLLRNEITYFL